LLHRPVGVAGVDGLLGHLYGDRGTVGDLVSQGMGGIDHLGPRRQLIGDAPGQRPLGGQWLAGEDQLLGSSGADEITEPAGAAPPGQGANADFRETECGVVSNDPQIASQRQLETTAVRVTRDRSDGGLPESCEAVEHPMPKASPERPHIQRLQGLEALDVGPGTERAIPDSSQQDDPRLSIGIEGDQDLLELLQHFRG